MCGTSELISFREKAGRLALQNALLCKSKRDHSLLVRVILLSFFNGLRMDKAHGDYVLTYKRAV